MKLKNVRQRGSSEERFGNRTWCRSDKQKGIWILRAPDQTKKKKGEEGEDVWNLKHGQGREEKRRTMRGQTEQNQLMEGHWKGSRVKLKLVEVVAVPWIFVDFP